MGASVAPRPRRMSISIRRKMFHLTRVAIWAAAGFKADGEVLIRPSQTGVVSTKPRSLATAFGVKNVTSVIAEPTTLAKSVHKATAVSWAGAGQARTGKATDLRLGGGHGAFSDIASLFCRSPILR